MSQGTLTGFESQLLLEPSSTLGLEEHQSPAGPFSALDSDRHFTPKSWLCVGRSTYLRILLSRLLPAWQTRTVSELERVEPPDGSRVVVLMPGT